MTIRFACECGQQLAVKDEHAGRKVRCTSCAQVIAVPGDRDEEPRSVRPSATIADRVRSERRHPLDEDDERSENDRPRRRKKQGGVPGWLFAVAGLVLLAGGAFLVWKLFFTSKDEDPVADLDMVPRNSWAFFTSNLNAISKDASGKKQLEQLRQAQPQFSELEKASGLSADDLERFTLVLHEGDAAWMIFSTSKPYDRKGILNYLKANATRTYKGKTYHHSKDTGSCVLFRGDKQLVVGSEEGIRAVLDLPAKPAPGPLDEFINRPAAQKHRLAGAVQLPPEQRQQMRFRAAPYLALLAQFGLRFDAVLDFERAFLTLDSQEKFELELTLEMSNAERAQAAGRELETGLKEGRKKLDEFGKGAGMFLPDLMTQGRLALDQLKPKVINKKVVCSLSLDAKALERAFPQR